MSLHGRNTPVVKRLAGTDPWTLDMLDGDIKAETANDGGDAGKKKKVSKQCWRMIQCSSGKCTTPKGWLGETKRLSDTMTPLTHKVTWANSPQSTGENYTNVNTSQKAQDFFISSSSTDNISMIKDWSFLVLTGKGSQLPQRHVGHLRICSFTPSDEDLDLLTPPFWPLQTFPFIILSVTEIKKVRKKTHVKKKLWDSQSRESAHKRSHLPLKAGLYRRFDHFSWKLCF